MANANQAISALSDATRRAIFDQIAEGPKSVGEIAERLPVTRPAVSQHLKILKEAELVADEAVGTRRVYRIDPAGLGQIRRWLDEKWERALGDFKAAVEEGE
ncbi:metalloregulator ArsR/SmtB family transcription factor [Sphingomonas sp. LB-2]|uniref:ArsR/SmtB family transcription factor n=1 Tax=Sphingomonas caeni TaxID=2984949 RepID=UPI00222F4024|nr:metalloregulator ArsR/SmtB family transcription factor [Sphingomonas caeni]MCW3846844.1 metalloregulator ArsR/SmtB family transcription factor [Sphingomonas caeni]